jgi:hypothetical protein
LLRTCHHIGPYRVKHHILYEMKEVGFAVNKNGLVPPLEDVPHTPMMPVELLCVDPV